MGDLWLSQSNYNILKEDAPLFQRAFLIFFFQLFLFRNEISQSGFKNPLTLASADNRYVDLYIAQQFVEKQGVRKSNFYIRYQLVASIAHMVESRSQDHEVVGSIPAVAN